MRSRFEVYAARGGHRMSVPNGTLMVEAVHEALDRVQDSCMKGRDLQRAASVRQWVILA